MGAIGKFSWGDGILCAAKRFVMRLGWGRGYGAERGGGGGVRSNTPSMTVKLS
jgi:hypothetical protein